MCFKRKQKSEGQEFLAWSTPSRIIGFEGKTVWVLNQTCPVATSQDKLRPCTAPEIIAHMMLYAIY